MYRSTPIAARAVAGAMLSLLALSSPTSAQCQLHELSGAAPVDRFGQNVDGAGDVNGDGFSDVIVGAPLNDDGGADAGMARVFSGLDGALLHTLLGTGVGDQFGKTVSGAGDTNGDGYDDFVVGAPFDDDVGSNSGSVTLFSGLDAAVLHTFNGFSALEVRELGWSVGGAGDVNDDGYDDVIAGGAASSVAGTFAGHARVYSGIDGTVLHMFDGVAGDRLGGSVNGAGDVDGDGHDDVVVAGWASDRGGPDSGVVHVYSGLDGSVLHTFVGAPGDELGNDLHGPSVDGAGDVDGDGYADIIAGARVHAGPGVNAGQARVWSGFDGTELHTLDGTAGDFFGTSVAGLGDVNQDGYDDFVVGATLAGDSFEGTATVFSGVDGSVLMTVNGNSAVDLFGRSVGPAGDVNGDGLPDLIVGADQDDPSGDDSGSAVVFLLRATFFESYCSANPNSTGGAAAISFSGSTHISDDDFVLNASPVPDDFGIFFFGPGQIEVPFGNGFLCISAPQYRLLPVDVGTSSVLSHTVDFGSPAGALITPGQAWNFQAWFRDPAGGGAAFNTSDGIQIVFCP